MKIEIKKEKGYEGHTFYCIYIDYRYHSSKLDFTLAVHEAEEIERLLLNPEPAEVLYSKEI